MKTFSTKKQVYENGFIPLPHLYKEPRVLKEWQRVCDPIEWHNKKYHYVKKQSEKTTTRIETIINDTKFDQCDLGILLGINGVMQLDFDIRNEGLSLAMMQWMSENYVEVLDQGIMVQGMHPKWSVIVRYGDKELSLRKTKEFHDEIKGNAIEFRYKGQFMAVEGSHPFNPDGYDYLNETSLQTSPVSSLPIVKGDDLENIRDAFEEIALGMGLEVYFHPMEIKRKSGKVWNSKNLLYKSDDPQFIDEVIATLGAGPPIGDELLNAVKPVITQIPMDYVLGQAHKHKWQLVKLLELLASYPPHYYDDFNFWFAYSSAMKDLGINNPEQMGTIKDIWDAISKVSDNYDYTDNCKIWDRLSLEKRHYTLGTIVHMARKASFYMPNKAYESRHPSIVMFCIQNIKITPDGQLNPSEVYSKYEEFGGKICIGRMLEGFKEWYWYKTGHKLKDTQPKGPGARTYHGVEFK